jgi:hypothetical protein
MLLCWSGVSSATHGSWMDHYFSANAAPCCGLRDCRKAHVRVIKPLESWIILEVDGITITIPEKSFHASEDLADYWCAVHNDEQISSDNTRCVFLAIGT